MFSLERAMMTASRLLEKKGGLTWEQNQTEKEVSLSFPNRLSAKRILVFALNPDAPPGSLLLRMNLSSVWKIAMPVSSWVLSTLSVAVAQFPNAKLRTREEGTAGEGFRSLTS